MVVQDVVDALNAALPQPGSAFYRVYATCWGSWCAAAVLLALRDRRRLGPELRAYRGFLLVPWKLALFVPAFLFVTFAGRFTTDDTWDVVTGGGMAALAYLTAPWAVGVAHRCLVGLRPRRDLLAASAVWLLSSSWAYDAYLTWRDGAYPLMWLPNLCASPVIYAAAGLLWNLEVHDGRPTASFLRGEWPKRPADARFGRLMPLALGPVAVAVVLLTLSVGWHG